MKKIKQFLVALIVGILFIPNIYALNTDNYDSNANTDLNNQNSVISNNVDDNEINNTVVSDEVENINNEVQQIDEEAYVQIGDKTYTDLQQALNEVTNGQTIKLLHNIESDNGFGRNLEQSAINFTIDLNGFSISTNSSNPTLTISDGSTVTIIGSGKVENKGSSAALHVKKGKVTLKGGEYISSAKVQATQVGSNDVLDYASELVIQDGATIRGACGVLVAGTNSSLIVQGGLIDSTDVAISTSSSANNVTVSISGGVVKGPTGIGLWSNSTLNITGGTIIAEGIGINSNYSVKNSNINISGGSITGQVGIYKPQDGKLSITGGTITGEIGIVARQGEIEITGGTIRGTGNPDETIGVGHLSHRLKKGSAIIVDNESTNYGEDITVVITGGTFDSTSDDCVSSFTGEEDTDDFDINGGSYNHPPKKDYVPEGTPEVNVTQDGNSSWHVGNDAQKAVDEAVKKGDAIVDVLEGDITVEAAPDGFIVKNSGNGNVSVNGKNVLKNEEYVVKSNDMQNVDITNPNTSDNIYIMFILLMVSGFGIIYIIKKGLIDVN